jgi:hypothetical protein
MTYKVAIKEKHKKTIPSSLHHHNCFIGLLVVEMEPLEKDESGHETVQR